MKNELKSWLIAGIILLAIMGLLGYLPGMGLLGSIGVDYIPMAPSTAVCFLILAMSLATLNVKNISGVKAIFPLALTLLASLFGILEVIGYYSGKDLVFEDTLVPYAGNLHGIPIARMSPATGAIMFLSGMGAFFIVFQKKFSVRNTLIDYMISLLGILVMLISLVFCLAYLYGTPLLYESSKVIPMALTTAMIFMLLSIIIISYAGNVFPLRLLTATSTHSYLLRFIFPFSLLSVILGVVTNHYSISISTINPAFISAIMAVLIAVISVLVATFISRYMGSEFNKSRAELHKANEELRKNKAHLQTLIKTLPDYLWLKDTNGVYLCCNQKIEKLFNAKESDIVGKKDHDFVEIDLAELFRKNDMIAMANGKPCMNEEVLTHKDGRLEIVETIKTPMYDDNGTLIGVLGIARDITRRKQDEKSLMESEVRFRSIFNQTFQLCGIVTNDGILTASNKTALDFIGATEADVINRPFWETPWWGHSEELREWLRDTILKAGHGETVRNEVTHYSLKGELHCFDFSLKPVVGQNGEVLYLIAESRDITVRKEMEDSIRQNAVRYRELVDNMSDGLAIYEAIEDGRDFVFREINHAGERIGKVKRNQIIGHRVTEIFPGIESIGLLDAFCRVWKSGISETIPARRYQDERVSHWVENYVFRIPDGEIVAVYNDITKRKLAEDALVYKEREQREILNSMADSVISINQAGTILTFNMAAEKLFGYTSDEIIGQSINLLMPYNYTSKHDNYIQHFIDTGESRIIGIGREVEGQNKAMEIFPIRLSVAELPENTDGVRRFIGSCHDLTQYKQHEEQLRHIQKMDALGKLTGGIAHDYNNMLGVVLGYAELLENTLGDQPKLVKYIRAIRHAGDRGSKLTKKLLAFSRHIATDAELLNINTLLLDDKDMIAKTLTARIKLVFDLADELWPVWADVGDLEDAILNLSINAMHAMEEGGQLTIKTSNMQFNKFDAYKLLLDEGEYAALSVSDTGCGMNDEIVAKIFEPFFSTKGGKGTGLGLSQVHGFMDRCGGVVRVHSTPGHGTTFILYFPRYHPNTKTDKLDVENVATDFTGDETILIVDDEQGLLNLTSETLSQYGYNTICAENAMQALKILEGNPVDLLFSDVIMPDMDGYKLAEIVKNKYPAIKIQLASGFDNNENMSTVDENLRRKLLHKPFNAQILIKTVRELLDGK